MYKCIQYAPYRPINSIIGAAASLAGGLSQASGLEDQADAIGAAMENYKQGVLFNYRISKINERRVKKTAKREKTAITNEAIRQKLVFEENRRRAVVQARTFRETQKAAIGDSGLLQGAGSTMDIEADTAADVAQVLGDMAYQSTLYQTQAKYARKAVQAQSVLERMNIQIQRRADLISAEGTILQMMGQQAGLQAQADAARIGAFGGFIDGIASFAGGIKPSEGLATPNSFLS